MTLPSVVTSREALRDTYRDELRTALRSSLKKVPGGEWDGVPAVVEPDLEAALSAVFDQPVPPAGQRNAEVETPAEVLVHAFCPKCGISQPILVAISPELLVEPGVSHLRVKAKAKPRTHVCGQESLGLSDAGDGQTELDFGDLVGETREELVLTRGAAPAWDAVVSDVEDYCAAEAEVPEESSETGTLTLVCDRPIDHDGDHNTGTGFAWRYERVPVPTGLESPADQAEDVSEGEDDDDEANG